MPRFRQGTTDHDDNGRMGGSMKEDTMAKPTKAKNPAKAPAKAAEPAAEPAKINPAVAPRAARRAALEAEQQRIQATRQEDTPEAKSTPAEQKAAAEDQFAKADAAVVGNPDDPGEFRLRMAALGGL